ncbi:hypothetical protein [Sphingomonas sp.]|uniref:hypothetical protein n=1 Tax=Sphingomonas sp. TaxID=28214 RepID=UPI0025E64CCC|nr:hypothetical protein [Sphingomonas sp.]
MIGAKDAAYLRRRADEERKMAEAAAGGPARLAHGKLAELFDREADEQGDPALHLTE